MEQKNQEYLNALIQEMEHVTCSMALAMADGVFIPELAERAIALIDLVEGMKISPPWSHWIRIHENMQDDSGLPGILCLACQTEQARHSLAAMECYFDFRIVR